MSSNTIFWELLDLMCHRLSAGKSVSNLSINFNASLCVCINRAMVEESDFAAMSARQHYMVAMALPFPLEGDNVADMFYDYGFSTSETHSISGKLRRGITLEVLHKLHRGITYRFTCRLLLLGFVIDF